MIANKWAWLAVPALLALSKPAFAGDGAAAAEVLFGLGKKLAQEGKFVQACPKFEESQKLDPGMGTLYRLGDCYEHTGRTASAWAAFVEVAGSTKSAGQQARADDARHRAEALEPLLPKLVIHVVDPDVPDLVVKRADVVVGRAQSNTPLPVDPGDVPLEASAPGRKPWHGSIALQAKQSAQIEVPALEVEPNPPVAVERTIPPAKPALGTQRTIALVSGIAGVVGLGVGGAFGILSMSKKSDADTHCDAQNTCDSEGLVLRHDSVTDGNISTIGFIAGGVFLAAGVVLWLTAPSRSASPRAAISPRWAGLAFPVELP